MQLSGCCCNSGYLPETLVGLDCFVSLTQPWRVKNQPSNAPINVRSSNIFQHLSQRYSRWIAVTLCLNDFWPKHCEPPLSFCCKSVILCCCYLLWTSAHVGQLLSLIFKNAWGHTSILDFTDLLSCNFSLKFPLSMMKELPPWKVACLSSAALH